MARPKAKQAQNPWVYDVILWFFSIIIDIFFREIQPRGAWRVPKSGPIIVVAAPHANQFVDSIILMRVLRNEAKRRVSFLIAAHSMARKFIGTMARAMGALSVARALDKVAPATGKIFLPDAENDPTLIHGVDTDFTNGQFQVGGLIVLPKIRSSAPSSEIAEIISPTELRLKRSFKEAEARKFLTNTGSESGRNTPGRNSHDTGALKGTSFKVAPHVDHTRTYDAVFENLNAGGCIGIFPEGGSHDRTELLPLKAGVAIMALGTLAANPGSNLKIIPVGMNYFHAHKFRSRAVIEFGHPIEVHPDQVAAYKSGDKRNAVGSLLETVFQGLSSVIQTAPDYDTLMLVQAARRLYNPPGMKLPLGLVVELNRRLLKGYTQYKDDPRLIELNKAVRGYNKQLKALGIKDHQVEGNATRRPWLMILGILLYRLTELLLLTVGTMPGLLMFWPVFVATKVISIRKSKEALAASSVKLAGRDVISTWKVLVGIAFAPALYAWYTLLVSIWLHYNRQDGYYSSQVPSWMVARAYVPDWVPLWIFSIGFLALCTTISFAALRIGEIGMDIVKSLPPLLVALNPRSANSLVRLRLRREALSIQVTEVINAMGPDVFADFEESRIVTDPFRDGAYQSQFKETPYPMDGDATEPSTPGEEAAPRPGPTRGKSFGHLPRNESFGNIGSFGFFASRPGTPKTHSRSSSQGRGFMSGSFSMKPFRVTDTKESLDEVSKRIRGAMKERGRKRESEGETGTESSWDMASTGAMTPKSEVEEETKKDQ